MPSRKTDVQEKIGYATLDKAVNWNPRWRILTRRKIEKNSSNVSCPGS